MIYPLSFLALGLAASAAIVPRRYTPCPLYLTAVGELNGTITEDTIGESQIGGGFPQGIYYDLNGTMTDFMHHKCLVDPTSYQFQCVQGTYGTTRFTVSEDNNLMHDGCEKWLACPATGPGDDGSYNIFSDAKTPTYGCEIITIRVGFGCTALGKPPSSSCTTRTPTPTPTASTPALAARVTTLANSTLTVITSPSSTLASAVCPTDISAGTFQNPNLIVLTSPDSPDYAFGSSNTSHISPSNTTLFNFDIPAASLYIGTCALLFLFPYASSLAPSAVPFTFSGSEEEEGENGGLDFALLTSTANNATTYNTIPAVSIDYGKVEILPGNNYTVATFPCPAGTVSYSASSKGNVELDYTQNSLPSPIGLYIVPCV
jgi:hypothetical protein